MKKKEKRIQQKFHEIDDILKKNLFSAKIGFSCLHRFHGKIEKLQKFREFADNATLFSRKISKKSN